MIGPNWEDPEGPMVTSQGGAEDLLQEDRCDALLVSLCHSHYSTLSRYHTSEAPWNTQAI